MIDGWDIEEELSRFSNGIYLNSVSSSRFIIRQSSNLHQFIFIKILGKLKYISLFFFLLRNWLKWMKKFSSSQFILLGCFLPIRFFCEQRFICLSIHASIMTMYKYYKCENCSVF